MKSKFPDRRGRHSQERARLTHEHILEAAAKLFGEQGIEATSTNRIAAAAGIGVGTLYRHFPDKSSILDELIERLISDVEARFTESVLGVPRASDTVTMEGISKVVAAMLRMFTDVLDDHRSLVKALVRDVRLERSGLMELEPRLRVLNRLLLVQLLGSRDGQKLEVMTNILVNTGTVTVLRVTAPDVGDIDRDKVIAMTADMLGAWLSAEIANANDATDESDQ
ncbi:TetR/AcrR family transcriptional regulator [Nocardia rhizosphaerihabitans]|uniref:TetR/AcrR family transcriptional regulator n=1 Tax=Nocardia rhizosphaerihabitans TaxID=1691570 RepID=UPI00366AC593